MTTDKTTLTSSSIIHLKLSTGQQFYFGSLVAMFLFVTPEQIGRTLSDFYRKEDTFKKTGKFANDKCSLRRVEVMRAKQKNKEL